MTEPVEELTMQVEIDPHRPRNEGFFSKRTWVYRDLAGADSRPIVEVKLLAREEGHGFGVSEVIEIAIVIGSGAASELVADAVRQAIGGVVRRVRGKSHRSDGSPEGLSKLIEDERSSRTGQDKRDPEAEQLPAE